MCHIRETVHQLVKDVLQLSDVNDYQILSELTDDHLQLEELSMCIKETLWLDSSDIILSPFMTIGELVDCLTDLSNETGFYNG